MLFITGENQAVKTAKRNGVTDVLSINDRRSPFSFAPHPGINVYCKVFEDYEDPKQWRAPTVKDCQDILSWCRTFTEDSTVLIHCAAGVSRSTAAGLAYLWATGADDPVGTMRIVRPTAAPNLWMSYCFDRLIGANGELYVCARELNKKSCFASFVVLERKARAADTFPDEFNKQFAALSQEIEE